MRPFPIAALVATLLISTPAIAQQEQGDVEIQFSGSVQSKVKKGGSTTGYVQTKFGYYFTDRLELGAFPSLTFSSGDTALGMGAFGTYSFLAADAMTVPYLGAQYYKNDVSVAGDRGWAGFNGGVKFFFNRHMAFDVGGNYLLPLNKNGSSLVLFQVGLSYVL